MKLLGSVVVFAALLVPASAQRSNQPPDVVTASMDAAVCQASLAPREAQL